MQNIYIHNKYTNTSNNIFYNKRISLNIKYYLNKYKIKIFLKMKLRIIV